VSGRDANAVSSLPFLGAKAAEIIAPKDNNLKSRLLKIGALKLPSMESIGGLIESKSF